MLDLSLTDQPQNWLDKMVQVALAVPAGNLYLEYRGLTVHPRSVLDTIVEDPFLGPYMGLTLVNKQVHRDGIAIREPKDIMVPTELSFFLFTPPVWLSVNGKKLFLRRLAVLNYLLTQKGIAAFKQYLNTWSRKDYIHVLSAYIDQIDAIVDTWQYPSSRIVIAHDTEID